MCGRFFVNEEMTKEIFRIVQGVDSVAYGGTSGDVCPSQKAAVLAGRNGRISLGEKCWGFPASNGKQLVINARAENITTSVMFRDGLRNRRCIIPAAKFYEWNAAKEKSTFFLADSPVMYMAGIFDRDPGGDRFVIITTRANSSVSPVHDRMPLLLEEAELNDWIFDFGFAGHALYKTPPMLSVQPPEFEQMSLF